MNELDILAVFPHPDDAELILGGTLLKLKALGYRVGVLDMTRGEMSTRGTPDLRAAEAAEAARLLGLDARLNLGLPDGNVWLNDDTRRAMVRVLREHRPRVLFTTHWDDPHPDHAHTSHIVREAARLATMRRYDADFGQDALPAPPIVAYEVYSRLVAPSFIVDVSEFAAGKMEALRAYASQFHRPDADEPPTRISHSGFLSQVEARLSYYGALINAEAGEPFYVREALNVADPFALLTRPMNLYS
jgi:bacillithiol biosynthesis deacetylase BshB1